MADPPAEPRSGVPLNTPPAEMLAQPGSPLAENVYGPVPPAAVNVAEKAWPSVVCSEEEVVMDRAGSIDNPKVPLARLPAASDTVTEKLYVPADPAGGTP